MTRVGAEAACTPAAAVARRRIAFFDYPDVFEDFYPHYGVTQQAFATSWADSGNHLFIRLLQKEIGDVTWYCLSLAPELRQATHQFTGSTVEFFESSLVHRALWKGFYRARASWRWKAAYPLYAFFASYSALLSWPLLAALFRKRPDLIFVQDYANGKFDELVLLSKLFRVPLVAYHAGSREGGYIGKALKHFTIRHASALVVSSARERALLIARYAADPRRVKVILTPLDTHFYRPLARNEACATAGVDASRRYFLFVGRFDDGVKRISVLLRAYAKIASEAPATDLIVCGDGNDAASLRLLAGTLAPGRVHFTGWVTVARKLALFNAALALVLPSRKEGFPTVVGEALACGTPVVATDVGGIAEVVQPGVTGYLVPVDDESALTGAFREVLADPERHAIMRANARAIAECKLSHAVVAAQLRECLDEALCA